MVRERTEELRDGYQWPKEVLMDVYSLTPLFKGLRFLAKIQTSILAVHLSASCRGKTVLDPTPNIGPTCLG